MSFLEELEALEPQLAEIQGDLIASGNQLRLKVGPDAEGQEQINYMSVDGQQTYAIFPNAHLTRLTVREQDGKLVMSTTVTHKGETIGLVLPNGAGLRPMPCYTQDSFLTWRDDWAHITNAEFINVNAETVKRLMAICDAANFQDYKPRNQANQPARQRTTKTIYDKEARGTTLLVRHTNGVRLESFTLLPDMRKGPLQTEYTKAGENTPTEREGFTSYVDVLMVNMAKSLAAYKLPEDTEDRADKVRTANSQMSVLTGTNSEDDYTLRPTLGYATIAGEELSFFPERNTEATTTDSDVPGSDLSGKDPFAPKPAKVEPTE